MNNFTEIDPLWNLADTLTIVQAAALIAGYEPNAIQFDVNGNVYFQDENGTNDSTGGRSVKTAFEALKNAINSGKLKSKIIHDSRSVDGSDTQTLMDMNECGAYLNVSYENIAEDDEHFKNGFFIKNDANWEKSFLVVNDLREWLLSKGFCTGFFFPDSSDSPDYLDKQNPRYAPKLAAAINAWLTVIDLNGKTPKQAIMKWLREHAAEFGLSDEEGNPNETGIEEVAKVVNWQPGGGAPKTPSR